MIKWPWLRKAATKEDVRTALRKLMYHIDEMGIERGMGAPKAVLLLYGVKAVDKLAEPDYQDIIDVCEILRRQ